MWTPAWTSAGLAAILLTLAGVGQALLATSVAPDAGLLVRLALGAAGSIASLAVAVGALAGAAGGSVRLREERAFLALGSLGLPVKAPARITLLLLLPAAALQAAVAHLAEPLARSLVRDTQVAAAAAVAPREGSPVRLGAWWVALDEGGLAFTDGQSTGVAKAWHLSPREAGVLADLRDVRVSLTTGERVVVDHLSLPIAMGHRGRVHATERTTPDLVRQLAVSAGLGRDGYERWLLWKRSFLPLLLLPLGVAAAGLARTHSSGRVVGALLVGSWVAVRVCDARIATMGAPAAAAVLGALALALAAWAWRR